MNPRIAPRGGRLVAVAAAGLLVGGLLTTGPAQAAPAAGAPAKEKVNGSHTPEHPLAIAKKKAAQKDKALQKRLQGDKAYQGTTAKVGQGQYVELEREATDPVFVMLVEFGDAQYPDPRFQGPPPDGSTTDVTGPLHNEIPEPDRSVDNSTLWQADYDVAHYEDMYFTRMAEYYETQSSNRYSVTGDVNGWVKVPFNEALYGRNYCGGIVCATSKALVRDSMAVWVQQQLDSGRTVQQVAEYLKTFDVWDRYDLDLDGEFNEPDGYIDHMQIVHAGGDEAAGDPNQGTDAIWSHRWYANLQGSGPGGLAGVNIGANGGLVTSGLVPDNPTGVWLGDYTVQPENGGLGVFAHEYGHDLGLPDLYDTSGNTGGAENSTAFWSLMSSGANIGDGGADGIGDAPTDLSAWELFQLGWLNPQGGGDPYYEVARAGAKSTHKLGPNVPATKSPQAVFTLLPDKQVPLQLGDPAEGEQFFWSTSGDELDTTMTSPTVTGTALAAKVRYDIETDWDYAYLEATTDGATWTQVQTNRSVTTNPNSQNDGFGITGTTSGQWVDLTATLPARTQKVRFRYWTDVAEVRPGFMVDAVSVGGTPIAEASWVLDGFVLTTGSEEQSFFNAYVLENRQYDGDDTSLRTAYNFGFLNTRPDWVETYPYQNGLLVWYWDDSHTDNNVGDHPGEGLLLPVDAHPTFHHWANGDLMRQRILAYDSTFGTERTEAITLHNNGIPASIASQKAVPTFDDTKDWWFDADQHAATGSHQGRYQPGWTGVKVPKTGTTVTVNGSSSNSHLNITVAPR